MAQFYTLLKMAEYCIHIRALIMLCGQFPADSRIYEKIINPSFGTLCDLQEEPELIFQDPELAGALRWLDMLSCAKAPARSGPEEPPMPNSVRSWSGSAIVSWATEP